MYRIGVGQSVYRGPLPFQSALLTRSKADSDDEDDTNDNNNDDDDDNNHNYDSDDHDLSVVTICYQTFERVTIYMSVNFICTCII